MLHVRNSQVRSNMAGDHRHSRNRHDLCTACILGPLAAGMHPSLEECHNEGHTAYVHTVIHKPEMHIEALHMNRNVRDECFHDTGYHIDPDHTEVIQSLAGIHVADTLDKVVPDSTGGIILTLEELVKQERDMARNEPDNDDKAEQPAYSELCVERFLLPYRLPLAPLAY